MTDPTELPALDTLEFHQLAQGLRGLIRKAAVREVRRRVATALTEDPFAVVDDIKAECERNNAVLDALISLLPEPVAPAEPVPADVWARPESPAGYTVVSGPYEGRDLRKGDLVLCMARHPSTPIRIEKDSPDMPGACYLLCAHGTNEPLWPGLRRWDWYTETEQHGVLFWRCWSGDHLPGLAAIKPHVDGSCSIYAPDGTLLAVDLPPSTSQNQAYLNSELVRLMRRHTDGDPK